jgi:hypothetical protein
MSKVYGGGFITVTAVGFTAATGAASAASAIPVTSSGSRPNYVRVSAINESYVKLGLVGVAATANDIMIQPGDSINLSVPAGITHIAYIQGTLAGKVNVVPLENN